MCVAELRARPRVVLARAARVRPPLADVVQQRRQEERARARDLGGEARRERELVRELAARELPQPVDRGHRVNVHRVHVVDVVVHAARDRQKLGHHREQQPHVVELADDRPAARARLGHGAHELHEERRRLGAARAGCSHHAGRRPRALMASRAKGSTGAPWRTPAAYARSASAGIGLQLRGPGDRDVPVEEVHAAAEVRRDGPWRAGAAGAAARRGSRARASRRARAGSSPASGARPRAPGRRRSPWPSPRASCSSKPRRSALRAARACRRLRTRQRNSSAAAISWASRATSDAEPHELAPHAGRSSACARRPRGSARGPPSARRRDRAGPPRRSSRPARAGRPTRRSARGAPPPPPRAAR